MKAIIVLEHLQPSYSSKSLNNQTKLFSKQAHRVPLNDHRNGTIVDDLC